MTRPLKCLSPAALLALGCMLIPAAHAGWDQVGPLYEEIGAQQLSRCEFRLRFDDGRTPFGQRSLYLPAGVTMQYPDEVDEVQNLEFPIDYRTMKHMNDRGALAPAEFDMFELGYSPGNNAPFDAHLNLVLPTQNFWIADQHQPLALTYYQAGPDGTINKFMVDTAPAYFSLEANCQPAPVISGITMTASSQYASYTIDRVLDGDESTYWIGGQNEDPWILTIMLDQNYSLEHLNINWYSSSYQGDSIGVSYKTDNDPDWIGLPPGENPAEAADFDLKGIVANQVEIVIPFLSSGNFPVIREIEVRGTRTN